MASALHGWHAGEVTVQQKLGWVEAVADQWRLTENKMREEHRIFYESLQLVPITTIDGEGRPWQSVLAGPKGKTGFISCPDSNTLIIKTKLWKGDPFLDTLQAWLDTNQRKAAHDERFLVAGVGIDFSTRTRNKFAGYIKSVAQIAEMQFIITLVINETLGNCPKYINIRDVAPHPLTEPVVTHRSTNMDLQEKLPLEVINMIKNSDTVWVGSIYKAQAETAAKYPSHAGCNARGGLPGFVRVKPSDGRTVIVPDYSGDRFVRNLGNIESSKLASLTFIDFIAGNILYLSGVATVLVGEPAMFVLARHACILAVETTGFSYVKNAFPVRQQLGTLPIRSPYSPKVKYLVDEPEALAAGDLGGRKAKLVSVIQYSDDIATFRFKVLAPKRQTSALRIRPGQAVVLDFMDWIGPPTFSHMADSAPGSINDDRVRTWTVSSAHETAAENDEDGVKSFEMAMREMPGGTVTGALFSLLRKNPSYNPGQWIDVHEEVTAEIVGVTGDFALGENPMNMLWVAGGIGVTPFLSMLEALGNRGAHTEGDVVLAFSVRDPAPFVKLIESSFRPTRVRFQIDLFTNQDNVNIGNLKSKENVHIFLHRGRIPSHYWGEVAGEKQVFICGPGAFGDAAVDGLRAIGVPNTRIHREGFY